jgi:tRNA (cmo5U34)-methyltransferase
VDDWQDKDMAQSWDADPVSHNPTRMEQLDIMLAVLEDEYESGKAILDIGIGSGTVEELIFKRIPSAYLVGVDWSEPMVELAREKLRPYEGRYEVVMHDIMDIGTLQLPKRDYQIVISVQTIHNVADEYKKSILDFVHNTLEKGGLFLLLDRIAVSTPNLFSCYKSLWNRLDRVYDARIWEGERGVGSADTYEEHVRNVEARGDLPASLEQHLQWLRESGFEAACLHLHGNRALFAARKL